MTTKDNIQFIIALLGILSCALLTWHMLVPSSWQIDGFYGLPMYLCIFFMLLAYLLMPSRK